MVSCPGPVRRATAASCSTQGRGQSGSNASSKISSDSWRGCMAAEGRNTKGAGSAVLSRRLGGRQHPSRPDLRVNGLIGRRTDPAVFTWPERLQSNVDTGRQHATSGEAAARALGTVPTSPGPAVTHTESAGPESEKCDGKVKCLRRRNARPGGPGSPPLCPRGRSSRARPTHRVRGVPRCPARCRPDAETHHALRTSSPRPGYATTASGRAKCDHRRREPHPLDAVPAPWEKVTAKASPILAHQGPQLGAAHGRVARHMGSSPVR